ncbi:MAG TPA: TIM-barrel domain-containing protein, partial [Solirubrobacter sp.]|nr:TIM-barrel domain-containing protein [Solirubrobacter sp.]
MTYAPLGKAEVVERAGGRLRLRAGDATVEVTALAEGIWRVGLFPGGKPPAYRSEAVAREYEPLPDLEGVAVDLDPLRISFADGFLADDPGLEIAQAALDGTDDLLGPPLRLRKARGPDERYFGCGERTAGLEKTGSHQVFWNVDPPAGHTAAYNNLYTSIPFLLCLDQGRAHGLFLDNPGRVEFDLGKEDPARFTATAAGSLVYYVFAGPAPRDVLARYTELTGRIALPPLWALGNQQSKWGYMDAAEVRAIARGHRERAIPCDVIYLDIDHMDGYRVFTFDDERFPDPAAFVRELEEDGFKVVCITDPGVKVDEGYGVYTSGRERDLYCKTADGADYHNVVWPGLCAFPDFTNPAARDWWGAQQAPLVDAGVAGVWCDMDEPALFVPLQSTMPGDVVHPGGGDPKLHAQIHNVYGSLMARAAHEGLARLRPDRRPFVITRAGFAGLQRHALQWTGDNSSWWEHLWMSMPQLQNLGLSGVSFCGVDIGGFFGDCNGELLARWTEFGIFQPFCRNHSCKGTAPQEPWAFGEPWESVCRDMLELRMRLLPYLYSAFEEAARCGAPILRPLLFEHPDDPVTYTVDDEFLFGDALLVAPITRPGIEHRHVYLPAGTWVQWWTGERIDGPAHVLAHAPLGRPALYARANAAIPMWPVMQHTGETPDELTLRVFAVPGAAAVTRELYEDAGEGYGPGARRTLTCD